jgi:hypothetical protein
VGCQTVQTCQASCSRTLTLIDLDGHTAPIIGVSREDFGALGRNGCAALDQHSHDTTSSLDTRRERSDIKEILSLLRGITRKNGGLDSGTARDGLIGVDALVRLLAVEDGWIHQSGTSNLSQSSNHGGPS